MTIPTRTDAIAQARARGDRIAGVLPIHYPRALLRAHGVHPVEVWAPPGQDPTAGNAHFQAYACAIVRHGAALLLAGPGRQVDLILVPHTCDALQGLGSVLLDFIKPPQPVLTLYHPRGRRAADRTFLQHELRRLGARLHDLTGRDPSDPELHAAIDVEEDATDRLGRLCRHRDDVALSDREFYTLVRSREYLAAETFTALVDTLGVSDVPFAERALPAERAPRRGAPTTSPPVPRAPADVTVVGSQGRQPVGAPGLPVSSGAQGLQPLGPPPPREHRPVRLMLGGIVPEPMTLFDAINRMGAEIVADDLACGSRRAYQRTRDDDPYARLAAALMSGPPDPTLGAPIADRAEHITRRMRETGAQGLLVYDVKFCEPELFDLPQLRDHLAAQHLPMLHVEYETGPTIAQQTLNRIEAFVEMLQ